MSKEFIKISKDEDSFLVTIKMRITYGKFLALQYALERCYAEADICVGAGQKLFSLFNTEAEPIIKNEAEIA
jgi:hypothetical protein